MCIKHREINDILTDDEIDYLGIIMDSAPNNIRSEDRWFKKV